MGDAQFMMPSFHCEITPKCAVSQAVCIHCSLDIIQKVMHWNSYETRIIVEFFQAKTGPLDPGLLPGRTAFMSHGKP